MGEAASMAVMINSRGERMTKALEGTEEATDSKHNQAGEPERTDTVTTNSHMRLVEFSYFGYGGLLLINLILFITTFDLISTKVYK